MSELKEFYTLANGVRIPKIGFGTWQLPEEIAEETVLSALETGYRHIDTAAAYGNERGVGRGIHASGLSRKEVFVTTKIPAEIKTYAGAREVIAKSLENLGMGYVDLLLIHAPKPWDEMHAGGKEPHYEENVAVWRAMEEAYDAGTVRAVGVSNFQKDDIENILVKGKIRPQVNQIKAHIGNYPEGLADYCRSEGILIEAYSPIATGRLLHDGSIAAVAEKYGVSIPQLCVKYLLQKGLLPLPKTTHREYMAQNAQTDFNISSEDMAFLNGIKAASSRLTDLPNIGKKLESQLKAVGIHDFEQLSETGAKKAWLAILQNDPSACYRRLTALEGALRGVEKSALPAEVKEELKAFVRAAKGKNR